MRARFALAFLIAMAGACGESSAEERRDRPAPRVATGTAHAGAITVQFRFFGEAEALARAALAAGADGTVRRVLVREGDHVDAGQLLVEIDTSVVRARLRSAQLQREASVRELDQARRDAERLAMAGARLVSEAEIEQARARVSVLEANTERLGASAREIAANLQRHRVLAPFAGVVASRAVDPGDYVGPGTEALVLVGDDTVQVRAELPPDVARLLEVGAEASLVRGDEAVPAQVLGVVRALDPVTRTVRVRLAPTESAPAWLVPGAALQVHFELQQEESGAVVVPQDAVVRGAAGATRVVRLVGDPPTAELVPVVLLAEGVRQDVPSAIVRPSAGTLETGDVVVTRGNERLRPQQAVSVTETSAEQGDDEELGAGE